MAGGNRKRDILDGFDPNMSDPEDDNFDPSSEARTRPTSSKRGSRPSRPNKMKRSRTRGDYGDSGVDDDDDELVSDSDEHSFGGDDDEDDDDDVAPVNAAGRRARKAATKPVKYVEEDTDEDEIHDTSEDELPKNKKKKIVVLKTSGSRAKTVAKEASGSGTRRTRAKTEDTEEEFLELSNSGRHARAATTSKSPEAATRSTRNSKAAKPVPEPIAEAEFETSFQPNQDGAQSEEAQGQGEDDAVDDPVKDATANDDADELALVEGDVAMPDAHEEVADEADSAQAPDQDDPEQDDTDDLPIRRNTRSLRHSVSGPADQDVVVNDTEENDAPRRSTRHGLRSRETRTQRRDEEASNFDPDESGDGDGEGSDVNGAADADDDDGDGESSEQPSRGRAATRGQKRKRVAESADEEEDLDRDELADEAEELRRTSRSRSKRQRRRRSTPPAIEYERSKRRTAKVDYTIKMPQEPVEQDDDDEAAPPASQRRRAGGANAPWVRPMISTFGPFGGAQGTDSLLGGFWSSTVDAFEALAGDADSDSGDDEGSRSGPIGAGTDPAPDGMLVGGTDVEKLGVGASPNVGKIKDRKALADADPLGVDMLVDFSQVGGLDNHVNALKEMVNLPLLYPEAFARFKMTPPRGVLFHGPPGTGKTLLARALANAMGSDGQKITFYMRKGADALSKWVGEAEKQLRLLFDEARRTQPSIIFFDEIDGLAPVRSSKQEQIHASIVSTLLALMDGMDGRGQVIVIGATNRPDNIDPALRRPGRFDREFRFDLPDQNARKSILDIHTSGWGLADDFKQSLAKMTKGYGGADIRALCTEAALNAIQRTFPQIYTSKVKLIIDPNKININATDFMISAKKMIPSSERSATSGATPLPKTLTPLLITQFEEMVEYLKNVLPLKAKTTALEEALLEPYHDADRGFSRENLLQDFDRSRVFRPRLLISGPLGMGQHYLGGAILHYLEGVHVQKMDIATIHADGRPVEQVIVGMFTEVRRHKPSVVYIPQLDRWYQQLGDGALIALTTMLQSLPPTDPILLLATTDKEANELDKVLVRDLFNHSMKNRIVINRPTHEKRMEYFDNVCSYIRKAPTDFPDPATRKKRVLEVLPVAPPPPAPVQSKAQRMAEAREDRIALNQLKIRLQPIMDQIKKKYRSFYSPAVSYATIKYLFDEADPNFVSPDVPQDHPYVITQDKDGIRVLTEVATGHYYYNLDIGVIEERISNGYYARPRDFYKDIKTLVHDARNIGDRKRILQANEMESNVDVDVAAIELTDGTAKFERLHARQVERCRKAEEKAKKRAALQAAETMVENGMNGSLVQSDVNGPTSIGAPVPVETRTTAARFRVMSPAPGEPQQDAPAVATAVTNGDSAASQPVQSGSNDTQSTQMGPPQLPRAATFNGSVRGGESQTRQTSQISTQSALPPGVNTASDASTTDRSSTNWSTQATNGYRTEVEVDGTSQPSGPSQHTGSTDSPWYPSQAEGLAHGRLSNVGFGAHTSSSPTSSQAQAEKRTVTSRMGLPNLLNDPAVEETASVRNSGATVTTTGSSQVAIYYEEEIQEFQEEVARRSSGCTIEQLEYINRELMATIWDARLEWNRMSVLNKLVLHFNDTMRDIEATVGLAESSQDHEPRETDDFFRAR